ncbi:MAG TPA: hypothetical protein VLS45_05575, partial [Methylomicrobium sp.]|nr:hypothetical protein [Methylomicrobium sp.]
VDAPAAINAIKQACKEKALPYVPANCKNLTLKHPVSIQYTEFSESYSALNEKDIECVNKCLDASYWSKHFGDCKE